MNFFIDNNLVSKLVLLNSKKKISFFFLSLSIVWSLNENNKISPINEKNNNINLKNVYTKKDSYWTISESLKFIKNMAIWSNNIAENFFIFDVDKKTADYVLFKAFSILVEKKIIEVETVFFFNQNKKKTFYTSKKIKQILISNVFTEPLKYFKNKENFYLMSSHYIFLWDTKIPNHKSGSTFDLKEIESVNNLIKLWINIDFSLLEEFLELYLKYNNLEKENLHKNYESYIKNYSLAIRQQNLELVSEISKKISIYQKAVNLKKIIDMKYDESTKFYLPWRYDFRGRIYFFSDISFTFCKEFRWCMFSGNYQNEGELVPKWHIYNEKIYKILDNEIPQLKKIKINLQNKNVYIKYIIIMLLISLAEIKKTKIGVVITIREFVSEGIKLFNKDETNEYEYEDLIKIISLKKSINEVSENFTKNKIKKRLISKDAPASVFQHLVANFGWKDKEILKWANLQSENTWYDTYSYFIDNWKMTLTFNKKEIEILKNFNRNTLKKTIMTENYGVGLDTAEEYFYKNLEKLGTGEEKNFKNLELFEDFFNFLKGWNDLKTSPLEIINYVEKNGGIIKLSDSNVDANYYKLGKGYTIDFRINNERFTKEYKIITNEKDEKKFEISLRANFVQSLDGALARWVSKRHPTYTIHDCFLVEHANLIYIVSLVNEGMNEKFHDYHKTWEKEKTEFFSLFILL